MSDREITILFRFRVFDREHTEEIKYFGQRPLLLLEAKKMLTKKLLRTINKDGEEIIPQEDDKTFMDLRLIEVSIDNGSRIEIHKWIFASEQAYEGRFRYKRYGRQYDNRGSKLEVIRTKQII